MPGNILLLGEYAVLEPDGLGVAIAVAPYVVANAASSKRFALRGLTPFGYEDWHFGCSGGSFICNAANALAQTLRSRAGIALEQLQLSLTIDSRAFFDSAGNKRGFGSSAAAVVALVTAVVRDLTATHPRAAAGIDLLQTAVDVHRAVQGGHGSGYDVAASLRGGIGLFRGGRQPVFTALELHHQPRLFLIPGPAAVSTREAINRYRTLKQSSPATVNRFVDDSNRAVTAFVHSPDWQEQRTALIAARDASAALGRAAGVPADPSLADNAHRIAKCLGAGNELVALFMDPRAATSLLPDPPAREVRPCSAEGL